MKRSNPMWTLPKASACRDFLKRVVGLTRRREEGLPVQEAEAGG